MGWIFAFQKELANKDLICYIIDINREQSPTKG